MTDEEIMEATTEVLTGKRIYYVDLASWEIEALSPEDAAKQAEARMRAGELPEITGVEPKGL